MDEEIAAKVDEVLVEETERLLGCKATWCE